MKRHIVAPLLGLVCGCAAPPHFVEPAGGAPVVTPLVRTSQTVSGQPLRLPQGQPAEVVAAAVDLQPGGRIALHRHPWSRFVYVERGTVRVVNRDTGATFDFNAGQLIVEAVDQWHEGVALAGPVRLVTLDLVPPGASNVVAAAIE